MGTSDEARNWDLFGLFDMDGSGTCDFDEIVHALSRFTGNSKALDVARLHRDCLTIGRVLEAHVRSVQSEFDLAATHRFAVTRSLDMLLRTGTQALDPALLRFNSEDDP